MSRSPHEQPAAKVPLSKVQFKGDMVEKMVVILQKIADEEDITLQEVENLYATAKALPDGDLYITVAPIVETKSTHVLRVPAGMWEYKGAQEN